MTDKHLAGKVAIVTGGASGIGKAIAAGLCDEGATAVTVDVDGDACQRTVLDFRERNRSCVARPFDLSEHMRIPELVRSIAQAQGRIDVLINCAALQDTRRTILDIDVETWNRVQAVNLGAPMFMMQAVANVMIEQSIPGRIVNITSSSAFRAVFSFPAYGSSKAGLTQLTRSAAADLGLHGINVNCVAPGVTVAPMLDKFGGPQAAQRFAEEGPLANLLKRPSQPEDIAAITVFLCLPASRQITGQTIHASAGSVV